MIMLSYHIAATWRSAGAHLIDRYPIWCVDRGFIVLGLPRLVDKVAVLIPARLQGIQQAQHDITHATGGFTVNLDWKCVQDMNTEVQSLLQLDYVGIRYAAEHYKTCRTPEQASSSNKKQAWCQLPCTAPLGTV
eukprot:jgi/Chrzof1/3509/Cz12g28030.t1